MGEGQHLRNGDPGDQENTHISIRASEGIHRHITIKSPLPCLFFVAILSLLTIGTTSWFLPDAGNFPLIACGFAAAAIIILIVAVTASVIYPHAAPE